MNIAGCSSCVASAELLVYCSELVTKTAEGKQILIIMSAEFEF